MKTKTNSIVYKVKYNSNSIRFETKFSPQMFSLETQKETKGWMLTSLTYDPRKVISNVSGIQ